MKSLPAVLLAAVVICGGVVADSAEDEPTMGLREESLEVLKANVESPGTAVVHMGSAKDWHRFYFSYERKYNDVISRGHGEFRCRNLKLVSTKGEELREGVPCMARVTSVDLEHRIVVLDIEETIKVIRRALEALEKESPNRVAGGN